MNIICFHNPNEENGYLSNWYLSNFSVDGVVFSSDERCRPIEQNKMERTKFAWIYSDDGTGTVIIIT